MVQVIKYSLYLIAFALTIHSLVWIKYRINPEERKTIIERKMSYEEADAKFHNINFKEKKYYEKTSSVVKITPTLFLHYKYDTLKYDVEYYSMDCKCN
jgi:hypothetical protein